MKKEKEFQPHCTAAMRKLEFYGIKIENDVENEWEKIVIAKQNRFKRR